MVFLFVSVKPFVATKNNAGPTACRRRLCRVFVVLAILVSRPIARAQSDAPDALYRNGVGEFAAGNFAEASKFFNELITHFGREPSLQEQMEGVYYAHGCALYNLGRFADAIEVFKLYSERYPQARYRDEALFRIAAAHQALEAYDPAVAAYQDLLSQYPRSEYAEDAAYQVGMCRMLQERHTDAVKAFADFMRGFPESEYWGQAGAFSARALFDSGKRAEAVEMLKKMEERPRSWSVVTYCNFLAFEIGDAAFDDTDYELALKAYRRVRTRDVLLRRQQETGQMLRAEIEAFRRERPAPDRLALRFRRERRLTSALAQAEELQKKLDELPDYDATLFHRIGRCFFNTDRYWEARVAFTRVVEVATDEAMRETAHFDLILVLSRLRRFDDLIAEADRYLAIYDPEWKRE
jgi:tetratricopeptide (TPR) repeat protein